MNNLALTFVLSLSAFFNPLQFEKLTADEQETVHSPTKSYTIIEKLGEGAFGKVYSVKDSNENKYAMKMYKGTDYGSLLGDMDREFERGLTLNHPSIIKSFELFTYTDALNEVTNNLVLQLVEGKPVYRTEKGVFSFAKAADAALQLTEALNYALSLGFYHLDLHQGNVMLTYEGDVMVIDLASFFTLDEINDYRDSYEYSSTDYSTEDSSIEYSSTDYSTEDSSIWITSEWRTTTGSLIPVPDQPIKEKKLKKFFKRNPELLNIMKAEKVKMAQLTSVSGKSTVISNWNAMMDSGYFSSISEMCISIIEKSDASSEVIGEIEDQIRALSAHYMDEIIEGREVHFEDYFDQLTELLLRLG